MAAKEFTSGYIPNYPLKALIVFLTMRIGVIGKSNNRGSDNGRIHRLFEPPKGAAIHRTAQQG